MGFEFTSGITRNVGVSPGWSCRKVPGKKFRNLAHR
jgi:hypothetical protein